MKSKTLATYVLLVVALLAVVVLYSGWLFMLFMGVLHNNVDPSIPAISFGASLAPGFLLSMLTSSGAVSTRYKGKG